MPLKNSRTSVNPASVLIDRSPVVQAAREKAQAMGNIGKAVHEGMKKAKEKREKEERDAAAEKLLAPLMKDPSFKRMVGDADVKEAIKLMGGSEKVLPTLIDYHKATLNEKMINQQITSMGKADERGDTALDLQGRGLDLQEKNINSQIETRADQAELARTRMDMEERLARLNAEHQAGMRDIYSRQTDISQSAEDRMGRSQIFDQGYKTATLGMQKDQFDKSHALAESGDKRAEKIFGAQEEERKQALHNRRTLMNAAAGAQEGDTREEFMKRLQADGFTGSMEEAQVAMRATGKFNDFVQTRQIPETNYIGVYADGKLVNQLPMAESEEDKKNAVDEIKKMMKDGGYTAEQTEAAIDSYISHLVKMTDPQSGLPTSIKKPPSRQPRPPILTKAYENAPADLLFNPDKQERWISNLPEHLRQGARELIEEQEALSINPADVEAVNKANQSIGGKPVGEGQSEEGPGYTDRFIRNVLGPLRKDFGY